MSLKNISGTPWHVGFGDKCKDLRRHKSKCIYYQNGYCSFRVQNVLVLVIVNVMKILKEKQIKDRIYICYVKKLHF